MSQAGELRHTLDMLRAQAQGAPGLTRRRRLRMRALVEHARSRSPHYRHLYAHLPAEPRRLQDLPPVTKPELMADFDNWVTDPRLTRAGVERFLATAEVGTHLLDEYFVCTTSGTTGRPGLFVHDRNAIAVYRAVVVARLDRNWMSPADLVRLFRAGMRWAALLGTGGHFAGVGWVESERRRDPVRRRAYRTISLLQPLDRTVAELNDFDPAILTSYPSALELLAEEQAAGRLRVHPMLIETGGETLLPGARTRIQEAFGLPVREVYGASEFDPLAASCSQGWLHLNSDWAVLEPVEADLTPTPAGTPSHTVLLTNLANHVQPLIRYDLGDSVLARPDPCPCGLPMLAFRVAGRRDDVLHLAAGDGRRVAVLPLALGSVIEEPAGVMRAQVLQTGPAALRLRLDVASGTDPERVWAAALDGLHTFLAEQGLGAVEVVRAAEPPEQSPTSGKFRQVIAAAG